MRAVLKKRNQLVSALLAGILVSGTATATVSSTPLTIAASDTGEDLSGEYESGDYEPDGYEEETEEYAEDGYDYGFEDEEAAGEGTDGSDSMSGEEGGSYEEEGDADSQEGSEDSESEYEDAESEDGGSDGEDTEDGDGADSGEDGTDSEGDGADSEGDGADSVGDGTDSGEDGADSGTDSTDSEEDGTDSGADGTDSGADSTDSGADSTDSGTDSTDSGLTEEEIRQANEDAEELIAEGEEEELQALEEIERQIEEDLDWDEEYERGLAEFEAEYKEEMDKAAEEQAAALKKQEEEEKEAERRHEEEMEEAYASYVRGYASGARTYYTGSYFVSEAQKRLSLNLGFKQVAKKYAVPKKGPVNILEGRADDARIVGVLDEGSLCYILEDNAEEWVFVESGDVRGFVRTELLSTGDEVDAYVEKTGESKMKLAVQKLDPLENQAYRYTLTTTRDVSAMMSNIVNSTVTRDEVVQFSMQFVGNPYIWGGSSLTSGTDCSGFTQQVYAHFGISIPRVSHEQAECGVKIPVSEAQPGDLIFYARNNVIYHVVIYAGEGKAVNAASTTSGIVYTNVDYDKACWACRFIDDTGASGRPTTQASQLVATGRMAYDGDAASKAAIIDALAKASEKEWEEIGFCRSVLIAQTIEESGWLAFHNTGSGIQATDNNVLGMNVDLLNDRWISPWTGAYISRLVPQYVNGRIVYDFEDMRVYQDIEACMEDYAAFKIGLHPELRGVNDVDAVIAVGLRGYATNPNYQSNIRSIIDQYNLTQYDTPFVIDDDETFVAGDDGAQAEDFGRTDSDAETPDGPAENPDGSGDAVHEDAGSPVGTDGLEGAEDAADDGLAGTDEDEEEDADGEGFIGDIADEDGADEDVITFDGSEEDGDVIAVDESDEDAITFDESGDDESGEDGTGEENVPEDAAEDQAGDDGETFDDVYGGAYGEEPFETDGTPEDEGTVYESAEPAETPAVTGMYRTDSSDYTQSQLELIWAIVAEEDDISYDGALAVISSVMNRADQNYGGFGTSAFSQLTADGQYCYSPSVADPIYYQRRLGGNVPDFVKQAVDDCLKGGVRSHSWNTFSDSSENGGTQIGSNWYYNTDGPETADWYYDEDDLVDVDDYDDVEFVDDDEEDLEIVPEETGEEAQEETGEEPTEDVEDEILIDAE